MLPEPKSPYAVTKLDGEYYCKMFAAEGWLETACMRYFNVFGPRQDPSSAYAAAIPIWWRRPEQVDSVRHVSCRRRRTLVRKSSVTAHLDPAAGG